VALVKYGKPEISKLKLRYVWLKPWCFQWHCMAASPGLWRKVIDKEWEQLNIGAGEDCSEL